MPGWCVPHYDGEAERRPTLARLVASGECPGAWAADDGAALWFEEGALREVVASRPAARAYRVDGAGERALDARFLGGG